MSLTGSASPPPPGFSSSSSSFLLTVKVPKNTDFLSSVNMFLENKIIVIVNKIVLTKLYLSDLLINNSGQNSQILFNRFHNFQLVLSNFLLCFLLDKV